jgi:hypothetical protein
MNAEIERTHDDLARLRAATVRAYESLETARRAEAAAQARADASQYDRDLEALAKATRARESRDRVHAKCVDAEADCAEKLAELEHAQATAVFHREREELPRWVDALAAIIDRHVALDHEHDALVVDYARVVAGAQDLHAQAAEHARKLGVPFDLPRPTLADARLAARRALLEARATEGREDLSSWLVSAPGDWQTASHSASELQAHEGAAARAKDQNAPHVVVAIGGTK